MNLAGCTQYTSKVLDKQGKSMYIVYTDFQKVFEQIGRYILLRKLEAFGSAARLITLGI